MRVPKQVTDALRFLAWCNRSDELVKVAAIADELGITKQMALKLVNILRQLGLLETLRGPSGGVKLTPLARDASVGSIVRMLLKRPELRREAGQTVEFGELYDAAMEAFLSVLDKEKLSDLSVQTKSRGAKRSVKKPQNLPYAAKGSSGDLKTTRRTSRRPHART